MYYDIDRGIYVSEDELRKDYENGISEMPTFEAYVKECITNGCLEYVKENETMMNEREYIIAKAKELGITAEELGVEDYKANLIQLRNNCQFVSDQRDELIIALRKLIVSCEIDPETAREYVSPDYWEDLGIAEKKYKIFKVTVKKTIYKDIYVAMPEDENECDMLDLDNLDNLDNDYPDDEEEWEVDDYVLDEDDLTEDEVNNRGDDIWNYDDFAE